VRFPQRGLSIIVLCNRRDAPYVELTNELADAALALPQPAVPPLARNPAAKATLARFAGVYFSDAASDGVLIEAADGAIVDGDRVFRQAGPTSFESSTAGTLCRCAMTYAFHLSAAGEVTGFDAVRPAGPGGEIVTRYSRMRSAAGAASDYAGDYVSDDLSTSWRLEDRGARLPVCRKGFEDRPLQLLWRDAAAGPGGILQFDRSGGAVAGFRLRNLRFGSVSFRKLVADARPVPDPAACTPESLSRKPIRPPA
jgi:hypothetical protein